MVIMHTCISNDDDAILIIFLELKSLTGGQGVYVLKVDAMYSLHLNKSSREKR